MGKAAPAFTLGAILGAIISLGETYFVAPPRMPAGLYYAVALFVAGFAVAVLVGHAWATAIGTLVGQIVYFVATSGVLPWHPMLLVILAFMIAESLAALLGAWLGQAVRRRPSTS